MAATAQQQQQRQVQPGELFGFPGVTRWTEQPDTNDNTTTVLAQTAATPLTGQLPFKQTDILFGWKLIEQHALSAVPGTDTVTTSAYFPYNFLQAFSINITNLYNVIDVQSGIDLAIFNFYRPIIGIPHRGKSQLMTTPAAFPYNAAANLVTASNYTIASAAVNVEYDIPAAIWFDEYIELDRDATPIGIAHRVPVSPLYMSGTARDVMPQATYAAGAASNQDTGPFVITTVGGGAHYAFTDTVTHRWQRVGIYGTANPAEMPTVFNWRYALVSKRVAMAGVSQIDIPLKNVINNGGGGQVLSVFLRMFDPSAALGGAPIAVTQVSLAKLLYGSALVRFQDTPAQNQARVIDQHDILLPGGVLLWDLARDDNDRITNARALNAYTTDITVHLDLAGATSATAYVVVGVEVLTFVIDQPVLG